MLVIIQMDDGTDRQRTDDDDGTDDGTNGQRTDDDDGRTWTDGQRTTTTGHDGTRLDARREDINLYVIIKFRIEHWDQVSNVIINRPSTLRFRHPQ